MPDPPVDEAPSAPPPGPSPLGRPSPPPLGGQLRNLGLLLVLSVVVVVVGIAISSRIRPPVSLLEIGSRAPALAPSVGVSGLPSVDQVASRAGSAMVIEFFKSDCPACEQAAPGFCDLLAHHPATTLVEVDADFETDQAVAAYRQSRFGTCAGLSRITFLADPCTARDQNGLCTASAHLLWKVEATPTVYVVDAGGTIVFAGVGSGTPAPADDALTRVTASPVP